MRNDEKGNVYIASLNPLPFLPLVYGYLRSFAEGDEEIKKRYQFQEPIYYDAKVEEVFSLMSSPEVLGLSCYYWNFAKHMKLAKLTKNKFRNSLIIAGGPQIPKNNPTFFINHPYIDILVHGEGEVAFKEVLRTNISLTDRSQFLKIKGISVNLNQENYFTGNGSRLNEPILTDSPYLLNYLSGAIKEYHKKGIMFYAPWETNRGCPYGCTFCDWGSATMNRINNFETGKLLNEIKYFAQNQISQLFICDANFGIQARDEVIAAALVEVKKNYAFPKQIRINFAKNSNARVFNIGKLWSDAELLMGVTVSLQSNDSKVLNAIHRKNIGTEKYFDLQNKLIENKIHSYTELILGLPEETASSFKQGIETVLRSGNHHDLRVYDLIILPNVPMNDPHYLNKYGIKTIDKHLYNPGNAIPEDEAEIVRVVIETNSLSTPEWIECFLFSKVIQFLHNGCYTRYIAIFLNRELGIDYCQFYERFIRWGYMNPSSVFGKLICIINSLYTQYIGDPKLAHETVVKSRKDLMDILEPYGVRQEWEVEDFAWIFVSREISNFYIELEFFLQSEFSIDEHRLQQLVKFQHDLILTSDYDPSHGKTCYYQYDFVRYFFKKDKLNEKNIKVKYRDVLMGLNNDNPIIKHDLVAFAKASVGESYPVMNRIRHFQHQIDLAEIENI